MAAPQGMLRGYVLIHTVDTAQLYGTEAALARTLSRLLPLHHIRRSDITLVTKWNPPPIEGDGDDVRPEPGLTVDEVYEQLLRSKRDIIDATDPRNAPQEQGSVSSGGRDEGGKRCAIEYIDVMLIHQPRPGPEGRARAWEALGRAKSEGWVREIGVSNLCVCVFFTRTPLFTLADLLTISPSCRTKHRSVP